MMRKGMAVEKIDRWLPWVTVIIMPIILLSHSIFTGRVLFWGIPSLQFIPWQTTAWRMISDGVMPWWNIHNGMGAPLAANYQLGLFYPPTWLVYISAWLAGESVIPYVNTLVIGLHLMFAGSGMVILTKTLRMGVSGQVVASLAFMVGQFLTSRTGFFTMIWAASWMPWIVLAAISIVEPGLCKRKIFLAGVGIGGMLLAGHAQFGWYILLFSSLLVLVAGVRKWGWKGVSPIFLRWMGAGLVGVMIAAVQLAPTAEYLLQSHRSTALDTDTLLSYSYWPWRLITMFAPDFFGNPGVDRFWGYANYWENAAYVGVFPLIMAFRSLGLVFPRHRSDDQADTAQSMVWLVVFLWGTVIISFVLAFGKYTPIFPWLMAHVPTFDMFNGPARWLLIGVFSLSLLAGFGVQTLSTPVKRGLYWLRLATAGGAAITIGAVIGWLVVADVQLSFIRATAIAGIWAVGSGVLILVKGNKTGKGFPYWNLAVAVLVGADLIIAGKPLIPVIDPGFYQNPGRYYMDVPDNTRVYLSNSDEYRMKYRRFIRFDSFRMIESPENFRQSDLPNINMLDEVSFVNNFDPFQPERLATVMEKLDGAEEDVLAGWLGLMNISRVISVDGSQASGIRVQYQTPGGMVNWYSEGCAILADSPEAALIAINNVIRQRQERNLIVLEKTDMEEGTVCEQSNALITNIHLSEDHLSFEVDAPVDGYVLVSKPDYPGWNASVDGIFMEIIPADYLFSGMKIPAGKHQVVMKYQPLTYWIGGSISLAVWCFILSSIIIFLWKRHPNSWRKAWK